MVSLVFSCRIAVAGGRKHRRRPTVRTVRRSDPSDACPCTLSLHLHPYFNVFPRPTFAVLFRIFECLRQHFLEVGNAFCPLVGDAIFQMTTVCFPALNFSQKVMAGRDDIGSGLRIKPMCRLHVHASAEWEMTSEFSGLYHRWFPRWHPLRHFSGPDLPICCSCAILMPLAAMTARSALSCATTVASSLLASKLKIRCRRPTCPLAGRMLGILALQDYKFHW